MQILFILYLDLILSSSNKSGFLLAPLEMMSFVSHQMVHVLSKGLRALFPWATGCPERLIQWRRLFPFPASVFLRLCILDSHLPLLPWIQWCDGNSLNKIIHNGGKASTFEVKSDFSGSLEHRAHPSPATGLRRHPGRLEPAKPTPPFPRRTLWACL